MEKWFLRRASEGILRLASPLGRNVVITVPMPVRFHGLFVGKREAQAIGMVSAMTEVPQAERERALNGE